MNSRARWGNRAIFLVGSTLAFAYAFPFFLVFVNSLKLKFEILANPLALPIEITWDNIHIDHIKPVSAFNLDVPEEMLDCCHYTNLQPLLAETNLNKSCKWNDKAEEFWCNNIKGKEYIELYFPILFHDL